MYLILKQINRCFLSSYNIAIWDILKENTVKKVAISY